MKTSVNGECKYRTINIKRKESGTCRTIYCRKTKKVKEMEKGQDNTKVKISMHILNLCLAIFCSFGCNNENIRDHIQKKRNDL